MNATKKSNSPLVVLMLVFGLLNLHGCGGSGSSSTTTSGTGGTSSGISTPYYKLTQGSTWTYTESMVYTPSSFGPVTSTRTVTNTVGSTASGITTIAMTDTTPSSNGSYALTFDGSNNLTMSTTSNLHSLFLDGILSNAKYMPAAPSINTTWTISGTTYKVTSTTSSITNTAGTFNNCLVVTANGTDNFNSATISYTYYFSAIAGGLVHIDGTGTFTGGTPFTLTTDLTSYTLH